MDSAHPTSERWLLVFETAGDLWLHERLGEEVRDRRVTRQELARDHPALAAELTLTANADCPRIVRVRRR
jgi:hypothetical protein